MKLSAVRSRLSAAMRRPACSIRAPKAIFVDGTVAPNTNIGAVGLLFMEDVTFGTNDTVKAYDGGTAFLE